jgi:hypothetical protein
MADIKQKGIRDLTKANLLSLEHVQGNYKVRENLRSVFSEHKRDLSQVTAGDNKDILS